MNNNVNSVKNEGTLTVTDGHNEIYCYIVIQKDVTLDETIYPMIQLASITDESYEPYTGGQPSPSPSYPQEIKSVVNPIVKVCGKNLLKIRDGAQTTRGVTVTAKDGVVALKGTATETGWVAFNIDSFVLDGMYILSSNITIMQVRVASKSYKEVMKQNKPATLENEEVSKVVLPVTEGKTYDISNILVQIEKGSKATSYEPYYEEQIATLPYTLNAIPVSSDGNVTVGGRQYIADYVDVERGKVVRMCKYKKLLSADVKKNCNKW